MWRTVVFYVNLGSEFGFGNQQVWSKNWASKVVIIKYLILQKNKKRKPGVKSIQTAGYNGARTVFLVYRIFLISIIH